MRIVFSGASPAAIVTTKELIKKGHEVIIIELDSEKINRLSDELDCSFIEGDAGKPGILKQVDPQSCDFLFCLTDNDQTNIITSLLGRSMGFNRIITSIQDEELEQLCAELELEGTIIPVRTMSHHLVNMVGGLDNIEISTLLKGNARFFSFVAGSKVAGPAADLELPEQARIIYYYRKDKFQFVEKDTRLRKGDEIVILTDSQHLAELNERWNPSETNGSD
jgi:trk system potassium uptake protein TrkA